MTQGDLPQAQEREPASPASPSEEPERRRQRRKTLTDRMVAALPKKRERYSVPDPELAGHYVRVMPSGVKSYCASVRDPSQPATSKTTGRTYHKTVWHTLGSTEVLKIDEARDLARKAIKAIRAGKSPVEPKKAKADSFRSVAENWIKRHVAESKLRTQPEIERCLSKYVFPHWAERDFIGIRRSDVATLLDYIEDHHGSRQADLVLGILRSIANWYATRHDDYLSPFLRGMRRHKNGARARILDDSELRKVWKLAGSAGSFGALIKTLLLTGQRRGAVLGMRWDAIDDDGVWKIPKQEREKGNAGSLKLPRQALAIIEAQPKVSGNPYVFAASRGDGPLNGFSRGKLAFDKRCGVTGWTLHDLRRCARSLLSRAGVSSEHAERVLGHTIAGVEGVYDRHAYSDEKADALKQLAALIEEIVNGTPAKVVRLKPKARANA
ncbi:MAG: integrase arm-type DNA-binding domain-containing protein [Pseudolabrys sp.]